MKVSIIVPVFNSEKFLRACINSILNQTLKEIEVILVNDGSTDSSLKICQEFKKRDSRVKIINQRNMGVGAARNAGLKMAQGKYIGFVDSDDYIEPNMYQELYLAITHYKVDIAICKRVITDSKREYGHDYPIRTVFSMEDNKNAWKSKYYQGDIETFVTNKLFNKSILMENDIFFMEHPILEDKLFLQDILYYNPKMVYIDCALYIYRTVEGSSVRRYHKQRFLITQLLHEKDLRLCSRYVDGELKHLIYERMAGDIYNCIIQEKDNNYENQIDMFERIRQSKECISLAEIIDKLNICEEKRKVLLLLTQVKYRRLSIKLNNKKRWDNVCLFFKKLKRLYLC